MTTPRHYGKTRKTFGILFDIRFPVFKQFENRPSFLIVGLKGIIQSSDQVAIVEMTFRGVTVE